MQKTLKVNPIGKPRMTQRDRWKRRTCVQKYYEFKDSVKQQWGDEDFPCRVGIEFVIAMPASWSKKKKRERVGEAHQQKPDIDNLLKALFDSLLADDSAIYEVSAIKIWGLKGGIVVSPIDDTDYVPLG